MNLIGKIDSFPELGNTIVIGGEIYVKKQEPLSEDKLDVLAEANITDEGIAGYYLGFRDAEKHHGIGGGCDEQGKHMNIYEARWNNVLSWAKKVKEYYDTGKYMIKWDWDFYPNEFDFVIDEENRLISIDSKDGTTGNQIYEYDLNWDHGSYTSITETNKILSEINLYRMEKVKI